MNTKLIESLFQIILSLSDEERCLRRATPTLLEEKLFFDISYPSSDNIIKLAQQGGSLDFLYDEPDLYTQKHGESV